MELELFFVANWAEVRVQAFQVGMDLVKLPANLASLESEERGTVMLAFQHSS